MKRSGSSENISFRLLSPSRDAIDDIIAVVNSLNEDDYWDFTAARARDVAIAYINDKPVAFSFTREYNIEDNELGVVFSVATNPNYRNKGYCKKLSQLVLNRSIQDPEIAEICWATDIDNESSIAVVESLGFNHWYDYQNASVYRYLERR